MNTRRLYEPSVSRYTGHSRRPDILVVDDHPQNLRLLGDMLGAAGCGVRKALDGRMALTAVQATPPDLILLDIMMPELDGYAVCRHLKAEPLTAEIPIVFLSALDEAFDKVQAFQIGAADYITKPFQLEEVLARVQHQLELRTAKQQIQQLNAQLEARVQERTHQLEQALTDLQREATERQRVQAQLLDLALHDLLTGLPNRAHLLDRLRQALDQSALEPRCQFALLFLNCDRFKLINNSFGHSLGDEILLAIAQRLQQLTEPQDVIARLGSDEFAILLNDCSDSSRAIQVAQGIQDRLSVPFSLRRRDLFVSASIGIVFGDGSYEQPEHLLRDADTAMRQAKALQQGTYYVFDPALHTAPLQTLQLETDLRRALQRQDLVLHYQPIVHLDTGQIAGVEALVRWQHPTRGLISPEQFIPLAEETGLIIALGEWVLTTACHQAQAWHQAGLVSSDFSLSVNISARQFSHPQFLDQIERALAASQWPPTRLKLEITESAIMDKAEQVAAVMHALRDRQIQLGLDDFGTGYSSLSYLHLFPVDILKIDRSFVQRLDASERHRGLIAAILGIAQALGIEAIAEGIETAEHLATLRQLNCRLGQGYWFAQPLPAGAIADLYRQAPQW